MELLLVTLFFLTIISLIYFLPYLIRVLEDNKLNKLPDSWEPDTSRGVIRGRNNKGI